MADEMPESLRQTVEKCLGAYNYRHHTKLVLQDMEDRNTISADCRFAVSCDILGKDVDIHEENGFFRLNIGLWK